MNAAIVAAHPDDEVLWAGGTVLMHPSWNWYILTLCRGSDPDRAPRFHRVLEIFHAAGSMGDLDDGTLACGQGIGLSTKIKPVAEIIENFVTVAKETQKRLESIVN